ncbi:MAG: HAMP domain-containing histidine kinase [Mycobacteriaceae bacterium]|nr:HAMP domain-containing histidine kinase [Mycobacteriaceae bacterium]
MRVKKEKRCAPRFPLRWGLVAVVLVLVACGLAASGVAVTSMLRHSLISRVDQVLLAATRGWVQNSRWNPSLPLPIDGPAAEQPPSKFYMHIVGLNGHSWTAVNDFNAKPALPPSGDVGPNPVTVGSLNGSHVRWRAVSVTGTRGRIITVAFDLSDTEHTIRALIWLQVGMGIVVLVVLGVAGYVVVQRSLRPLIEVEKTAAAIASGQLDLRVPEWDPRTEVGRLSVALNGMLARLQQAVASSESSAEQARNSEERMRRFIADASHELRTPLTTILGFATLYRMGAAHELQMLMSRIESESRRMGLLIDDLFLLARLDAQRPLERSRVDLLLLASDAVHDAQAIARNRKVTLEVFDGPGTPEVFGDDARLRQVLSNLVGNAMQHTPESTAITVRVGTIGDDAVLEVADQGPGMSKEDAARVFERFYRADSSRARSSGGTGLGLSIVDALVRAHGGTLSVTTAPGEGCCFRAALPRVTDVLADDDDDDPDDDEFCEAEVADQVDALS